MWLASHHAAGAVIMLVAGMLYNFGLSSTPVVTEASTSSRWLENGRYNLDTEYCNIKRIGEVSFTDFLHKYIGRRPVILRLSASRSANFTALVDRTSMLERMGEKRLKLSSSNSYSHDRKSVTVREYFEQHLPSHETSEMSNETWYFFGDNYDQHWTELEKFYKLPPYPGTQRTALSFGVGGRGSGVAFHFHGPGNRIFLPFPLVTCVSIGHRVCRDLPRTQTLVPVRV
jgi:hypothetical protein